MKTLFFFLFLSLQLARAQVNYHGNLYGNATTAGTTTNLVGYAYVPPGFSVLGPAPTNYWLDNNAMVTLNFTNGGTFRIAGFGTISNMLFSGGVDAVINCYRQLGLTYFNQDLNWNLLGDGAETNRITLYCVFGSQDDTSQNDNTSDFSLATNYLTVFADWYTNVTLGSYTDVGGDADTAGLCHRVVAAELHWRQSNGFQPGFNSSYSAPVSIVDKGSFAVVDTSGCPNAIGGPVILDLGLVDCQGSYFSFPDPSGLIYFSKEYYFREYSQYYLYLRSDIWFIRLQWSDFFFTR